MATANSKSKQIAVARDAIEDVTRTIMEGIDKAQAAEPNYKLGKVNNNGKMLMCNFTLAQRDKAPNPQCVTVNEEIRWIPRGVEVQVPWYVVQLFKDNIERRYRKEKDSNGKNIVTPYDVPAEAFSYSCIDPAPNNTF